MAVNESIGESAFVIFALENATAVTAIAAEATPSALRPTLAKSMEVGVVLIVAFSGKLTMQVVVLAADP